MIKEDVNEVDELDKIIKSLSFYKSVSAESVYTAADDKISLLLEMIEDIVNFRFPNMSVDKKKETCEYLRKIVLEE